MWDLVVKKTTLGRRIFCKIVLDEKMAKRYTEAGNGHLDNRIYPKNVPLSNVLTASREVAGCKVSLSFAERDNTAVEKTILEILEHELFRRTSTGGM